jgi:hypothetical protein
MTSAQETTTSGVSRPWLWCHMWYLPEQMS